MRSRLPFTFLALSLAAPAAWAQATTPLPYADTGRDVARFHASLEAVRLRALFDADWQWRLQDSPQFATRIGDHRFDDRLDDESPEAAGRRDAHARDDLAALRRIDRAVLTGEDRISLDVALQAAQIAADRTRFPALRTRVISSIEGVQVELPELMRDLPVRHETDARNALARLKAMPARIAQDIAWARAGKTLGWLPFKASLAQVPDEIDALLAHPLERNPLFDPFAHMSPSVPADRRQALQDEARAVLRDQVLPAYLDLRKVVIEELLPASPDNGALGDYPDGDAIYRLALREQTSLAIDPKALHDLGESEVARLRDQIGKLIADMGSTGSYADAVATLNHDPKYFYATADEVLAGYRDIAKRVDPGLSALFVTLPRTPYGVRAIPADEGAAARNSYTPGALDGSTPGWFNADVGPVAQRPKWAMAAQFLHEGVPGHHLQAARAHELILLPPFRRAAESNAYVEGWAMYAESLGGELGVYADAPARYGALRSELLRSARLVTDTGLHALGWPREQAVAYLVDQVGLTPEEAGAEVDHECLRPAQALGYKLGQMKLLELRQKARDALGDRFDLRAFHQEILDHGALPLPVLQQVVEDWIARVRAGQLPLPAP